MNIVIVATLCSLPFTARGGVSLDTIVSRLSTQAGLFVQEKVYLHLDHWQCARGERVNYRAYCVNAITHEPMDTSRFVYVELIDKTGNVLQRNKNVNDYGCATGFLTIPKPTEAGICFVRAYTRRSAELGARYVSVAPVMVSASPSAVLPAVSESAVPRVALGEQQGMTLACNDSVMRVTVDADVATRGQYLVLLNKMIPFYFNQVLPGTSFDIKLTNMPPGVGYAIVVNEDYDIVASACYAAWGGSVEDACPVTVKTTARDYRQLVDIALPGLQPGEEAQLSVGVTRAMPFGYHQDIGYHLDIDAEVPHGTAWTVEANPCGLSELLTVAGVRYDLQRALHGDYLLPTCDVEMTTTMSGTTRSLLFNRPVKNANVSGISPNAGIFSSTVSNDKGEFILGGLDAMGSSNDFVIQAIDENGSKDVYLEVKKPSYPPTGTTRLECEPYRVTDATGEVRAVAWSERVEDDIDPHVAGEGILLPNLEVRGFRLGHQGGKSSDFSAFSDFTITNNYMEERKITDLESVLRMIPGVFYRLPLDGSGEPRLYMRAPSSIYGDKPVAIAIDGSLDTDIDPMSISIDDIERIDVFKTGSTAMWGHNGAGGVISIKLKEGARRKNGATPNVQHVSLPGIQPPAQVKIDNNGKTLYWNPDVVMAGEDGHESFYRFEIAVPPGAQYEIVVEGITSMGRTIHSRQPLR